MAAHDDRSNNGTSLDRRTFLRCAAVGGAGLIWTVHRGPCAFAQSASATQPAVSAETGVGTFTFVQISDTHIGFKQDPNRDPAGTLREAIARINAMPQPPDFVIHTGDQTHLSKAVEFDMASEILKTIKVQRIFYIPGEHDELDDGKEFLRRYGKGTLGTGWHSYDHKGVHFVGLVNVADLKPGGMGALGREQLSWLKTDLESLTSGTPVIAYVHMPLWPLYPKWAWGTEDGDQAIALLKRFDAATVLHGHIHQIQKTTEGNVLLHTARSTAYPQPEPGKAAGPGPIKDVPPDKLRSMLGLTTASYTPGKAPAAIRDETLAQ